MHLNLAIQTTSFTEELAREIIAGGLTVVDATERLIDEHLENSVSKILGNQLIKAPRSVVHSSYYKNRFENLHSLLRGSYSTWYPEVRFAMKKDNPLAVTQVYSDGFDLDYISYSDGVNRQYMYSKKELKTQVNHTALLNEVIIPSEVFSRVIRVVEQSKIIEQSHIANLTIGYHHYVDDRIEGFRVVSFDHVVTGKCRFCRCHSKEHALMLSEA